MTDHSKRTGPAIEAHYQFLLWLVPTVDRFPRAQKFVFGDRILNISLDVFELLVAATFTRDRKSQLSHRGSIFSVLSWWQRRGTRFP